jgi:hypothetical protein
MKVLAVMFKFVYADAQVKIGLPQIVHLLTQFGHRASQGFQALQTGRLMEVVMISAKIADLHFVYLPNYPIPVIGVWNLCFLD